MSIKADIIKYLQSRDWEYGGKVEDYIRQIHGHKASNASRRCRELENEGRIEKREVRIDGVANKVVQYRIKQPVPVAPLFQPAPQASLF